MCDHVSIIYCTMPKPWVQLITPCAGAPRMLIIYQGCPTSLLVKGWRRAIPPPLSTWNLLPLYQRLTYQMLVWIWCKKAKSSRPFRTCLKIPKTDIICRVCKCTYRLRGSADQIDFGSIWLQTGSDPSPFFFLLNKEGSYWNTVCSHALYNAHVHFWYRILRSFTSGILENGRMYNDALFPFTWCSR